MTAPRILIAPNSFKECLSATEVAEAISRGARAALPSATVESLPLSDGGEGFVHALTAAGRGLRIGERVTGPRGEPVDALWGLLRDGELAVIEMAQAAGLERVPLEQRDPMKTTTFGVGALIRAACDRGAKEIIVGIGGSATNDGGLGMAQALGFQFLDAGGVEIEAPATGGDLARVAWIKDAPKSMWWRERRIRVACDVDNPLLGPRGATRTYAAQKGATPEQIERLERGMNAFVGMIEHDLRVEVRDVPGAGAAGGLGAGLMAFAGAHLEPGAPLVLDTLGFDRRLEGAALVITGEGAVNAQTVSGKIPWEVCRRAMSRAVPVLVLAGDIREAPAEMREAPNVHLASIAPEGTAKEVSMRDAITLLESAAKDWVTRLCGE